MIGHVGLPPLERLLGLGGRLAWAVHAAEAVSVSGPAAVIVFFVVSGFCIHHPFRASPPPLAEFYVRRFVRIGLPLVAAMALARIVGHPLPLLHDSILWSLVAELVYYALYPALRAASLRVGWRALVAVAFVAAAALVATSPHSANYPSFGTSRNWILGLPCWLLGCLLAERSPGVPIGRARIWRWRGLVWLASVVALVLRFHSPIGYPVTLDAFSLLVAAWLAQEIDRARISPPPPWLERAGLWSYSLYLVHRPAMTLFDRLPLARAGWLIEIAFLLAVAYGFYRVIERPTHRLALRLGSSLRARVAAM
jgi:peptidoglycan/LPS O-acetylase OafA/YrhL